MNTLFNEGALAGAILTLTACSLIWWVVFQRITLPWRPWLMLLFCLNQLLLRNFNSHILDTVTFNVLLPVLCVLASFVSLVLILHLRSIAHTHKFIIRGMPTLLAIGSNHVVLCLIALAFAPNWFVLASHIGVLVTLSGLMVAALLQGKTWGRRYVAITVFFLAVLWGFRVYDIVLLNLPPSKAVGLFSYGSEFSFVVVTLFVLAFRLRHEGSWLEKHETQVADLLQNQKGRIRRFATRRTRTLSATLAASQQINREQTRLMAYIGHDLRAPVASIVGYARMLGDTANATHKKHIAAIEHGARHQLVLIDELLDHVRGEFNLFGIKPVALDLRGLLEEIRQQALALTGVRHNSFVLALPEPFPHWVMLDGHRLSQVLLNLISNAAKFTQNGAIALTIMTTAGNAGSDWTVSFEVVDTGTGIAEADQERIFGSFEQAQSLDGGMGLGLFIARSIVQNMGGRLTLHSELGVGSALRFEMHMLTVDPTPSVLEAEAAAYNEPGLHAPDPRLTQVVHRPPSSTSLARLALMAWGGEWTDIHDWMSETSAAEPEASDFITTVGILLDELDFQRIRELATPDLHHRV